MKWVIASVLVVIGLLWTAMVIEMMYSSRHSFRHTFFRPKLSHKLMLAFGIALVCLGVFAGSA